MAGEKINAGSPSSENQTVFASQTLATTTAGSAIVGVAKYTQAVFFAQVSSVTGTSPTFDISIQTLMPDATTWQAIGNFAQITGTANRYLWHVPGASAEAATATSLTAATQANLGLGGTIRVNVVVGGTNPSGVVKVTASFFE